MYKIKLQTAWCNDCERITGLENGTCVVCNRRLKKELGAKIMSCPACGYCDYTTPTGMSGYLCPDCGTKIESIEVNPRYYYR